MLPGILLAVQAARARCWLMPSFLSIRTPKSLLAGLLLTSSSPSLYTYLGLLQFNCSILHLALMNLIRFVCAHFSSLSWSLWMVSLRSVYVLHHSAWCYCSASLALRAVTEHKTQKARCWIRDTNEQYPTMFRTQHKTNFWPNFSCLIFQRMHKQEMTEVWV